MILEELSIWIKRPRKENCPHQCRWASPNPLRTQIKQKGRGRANLVFLLELRHMSSPVCEQWHSSFWGSWAQTGIYTIGLLNFQAFGLWITSWAFLFLQLMDSRYWDFSAFRNAWVNSYNKTNIFLCLCNYWFWFSGECWVIQQQWRSLLKVQRPSDNSQEQLETGFSSPCQEFR